MQPPKPLPEGPGPWGALYGWLNQLLEFCKSIAPVQTPTVHQSRTSKGTAFTSITATRVGPPGEEEATTVRWG